MRKFIGVGAVMLIIAGGAHKVNGDSGMHLRSLSTEVPDPAFVALIGTGRNSITEEWKSQCIKSNILTSHDNDEARFIFDRTLSESEIESSFGLKASAKASYGLFSGSARSSFAKSTYSSSRSITIVYKASVVTGTDLLDESNIEWLVKKDDQKFFAQCGDTVVRQIKRGGELYLLLRMDFGTESEKVAFQAALGGSYGANEVNAKIEKISKAFSHRAAIHMEAYQYGGNAYLLGTALNSHSAVTCDMSNMTACNQFMESALNYASGKFPSNISSNSGALQYTLRDWKDYNAGPNAQDVPASVQTARDALLAKLRLQIDIQNRYDSLKAAGYFGAPQSFRTTIEGYNAASKKNVQVLGNAIKACYDKLNLTTSTSTSNNTSNAGRRRLRTPHIPTSTISNASARLSHTDLLHNLHLSETNLSNELLHNLHIDYIGQCVRAASESSLKAAGYKDLNAAFKNMEVKLPVSPFEGRSDFVKLITPGAGYWGGWSKWAMCPKDQFAIGYKMRAEGSCGDCDDTALNAVELICANWPRTNVSTRRPHSGLWGTWHPEARCTYGPINGMSIRIEPKLGEGHDDTAANDLNASCASGEELHAPGGLGWGSFSEMQYCPAGSAVCGAQVRFEGKQGDDDDTAMNGISLACCAY